MVYLKIDLYEYFHVERKEHEKGFLTVYAKKNSKEININRRYPGIIVFPGGGYEFTSDREGEPVALKLLNNNIQAFVLEYSCTQNALYPAQLLEGYLALKYISDNRDKLNIDINKIGVIGFSAGGHLAGLVSNFFEIEHYKDILGELPRFKFGAYIYPVNYYDKTNSHSRSFINLTRNNEELMKRLSFEDAITKDSPNAFFVSTFKDKLVGYQNTLSLVNKYSSLNIPFEVHIFNKGEHGISLGDESVELADEISLVRQVFSKWFELFINFLKVNAFLISK